MNGILAVARSLWDPNVERLGWVLIHSLWQFAVVGLVAAIVLRLLRNGSSTARHGVLVCLLGIAATAPVATALWQPVDRSPSEAAPTNVDVTIAATPRADRARTAGRSSRIAGPAAELLTD
jgi:hypothetical protein